MSRYIDADALGIGKADRNAFTIPEYADGWNSAIDVIANAPTADVVEVVRCKDCKFYKVYEPPIEDFDGFCTANENEYDKDFFCQYGERREENGT